MLSVPQIEDIVKAAPMPMYVKAQILDQIMGQHDALDRPEKKTKTVRPMSERVGEARRIGAFDYMRTEPNRDEVYAYCKLGKRAYEIVVRDGHAVHCGCKNFEIESAIDPEYQCKHLILWETMAAKLDDLIADAAEAAATFMQAWLRWRLGTGTADEANAAGRAQDEARSKVECFLPQKNDAGSAERGMVQ